MKITRSALRDLIQETVESHEYPYHGSHEGKTESQAQQEAAGIALEAVRKYGKEEAIRRLKGPARELAHMTLPELNRLATIRRGAEVPDYTEAGKEERALPKRIEPSPSSLKESRENIDMIRAEIARLEAALERQKLALSAAIQGGSGSRGTPDDDMISRIEQYRLDQARMRRRR